MLLLNILKFLLTHPVWDVTNTIHQCPDFQNISTHTSRVGCDSFSCCSLLNKKAFLLTHPVWDVTNLRSKESRIKTFLLTHPVWDVTRQLAEGESTYSISTHTSRVGCDFTKDGFKHGCYNNFYSHIPCGM